MAIKWKTSIPEWTNMTASGTDYTLCGADDDMSSIKSISIVNGNTTGSSSVKISIWIDTSGMDNSSPEYSTTPIYLVRKRSLMIERASVFNSIINNATWSSKGAVLKCNILVPIQWQPSGSSSNYWFAGSIILSGQNDSTNTPNIAQF